LSRIRAIFTNIVTAVVTALVTSVFWISAYGSGGRDDGAAGGGAVTVPIEDGKVEAAGEKVAIKPAGAPRVEIAEGLVVGPTGLAIPVVGVRAAQLQDTFTQARAGGARVHDAIDIMAPRGRPVVASAPGTVEKLFFSQGGGGITAYIRSTDNRWTYYYAHLDRYAKGLREGKRIRRGEVIGTVGSTGNADRAGPHLHFAIHRMQPGERWWQGSAINPYPLLAGRRASR
jgi:murein DD-endopeptidase MepM/ murein hydrolase activator NlpD